MKNIGVKHYVNIYTIYTILITGVELPDPIMIRTAKSPPGPKPGMIGSPPTNRTRRRPQAPPPHTPGTSSPQENLSFYLQVE